MAHFLTAANKHLFCRRASDVRALGMCRVRSKLGRGMKSPNEVEAKRSPEQPDPEGVPPPVGERPDGLLDEKLKAEAARPWQTRTSEVITQIGSPGTI